MESKPRLDQDITAEAKQGVARAREVVRFYKNHESELEEAAKNKPYGQALMWMLSGSVQIINILTPPAMVAEFLNTNLVDKPLTYAGRLKDKIKDSFRK